MQPLSLIFGATQSSAETPSKSEQGKVSILAVEDVLAQTVDEQAKKVIGSSDLRTDPFNGSWAEGPFKQKWTCRYKNFFLGETKSTDYEDSEGNMIRGIFLTTINEPICQDNWQLLRQKELPNGKIRRKYVEKIAGKEYHGVRKVTKYGFTISDQEASYLKNQKTGELYFKAFRIIHEGPISESGVIPWSKEPGIYENPNDLADFNEFCRVCNIGQVVYPPSSPPENQGKNY